MRVEFTTFLVKQGMEDTADEWMRVLRDRQEECVKTLERERMHYESIFRTIRDGRLYLSWFSVQGEGGEDVEESDHDIDKLHLDYGEKCLEPCGREDMEHIVSFVPESIAKAIEEREKMWGL